jgi:hypothetical protein
MCFSRAILPYNGFVREVLSSRLSFRLVTWQVRETKTARGG